MSGQCRESDTSVDADVALRSEERQICRGRGQAKGPWITSEENSERTEATACRRQLSESTVSPTPSRRPRHSWLPGQTRDRAAASLYARKTAFIRVCHPAP